MLKMRNRNYGFFLPQRSKEAKNINRKERGGRKGETQSNEATKNTKVSYISLAYLASWRFNSDL